MKRKLLPNLKTTLILICSLFLMLGTQSSEAQTTNKRIPLVVSAFNKANAHFPSFRFLRYARPGVMLGTEWAPLSNRKFELPLSFNIGYSFDPRDGYDDHYLYANIELINRFKIWMFQLEPSFGVTYAHTFRQLDPGNGDPVMLPESGLPQLSPTFGFGFGFDFHKLGGVPIVLFFKAQVMPVIPIWKGYEMESTRSLAHLGLRYYFGKKKVKKDSE